MFLLFADNTLFRENISVHIFYYINILKSILILSFVFKASKIAGKSRFTRRIFSNCKKTTCDFLIFTFVKKRGIKQSGRRIKGEKYTSSALFQYNFWGVI